MFPTVTPPPPATAIAVARAPAPSVTPVPESSVAPAKPPAPSATIAPAATDTSDGPVTPSMAKLKIGGERYAALGDPAAPVTIVEYSDYGCPFCRIYELTTFPQIKARYIETGKVYYVYKDFPVVSEQGGLAAQAAECAGEQGRYWEMHAKLFIQPKEWNIAAGQAKSIFGGYADALGMERATLEQCVAAEPSAAEVEADFQEGLALGLQGTPAFIINGKLLSGAQSIEIFDQVLERALNER